MHSVRGEGRAVNTDSSEFMTRSLTNLAEDSGSPQRFRVN